MVLVREWEREEKSNCSMGHAELQFWCQTKENHMSVHLIQQLQTLCGTVQCPVKWLTHRYLINVIKVYSQQAMWGNQAQSTVFQHFKTTAFSITLEFSVF